ncbi:MAG: hypothetical protein RLZZ417_2282 [Bacteroidota bacterium]|jgi:hypothetical protein
MKKWNVKFLSWIYIFCSFGIYLNAQNAFKIVSKRIDKSFPYQDAYSLNIDGEKAEVSIETWDKPLVLIQMEITAKNQDKELAALDIEKMKYLIQRVKDKLYVRNYLSDEGENPTSLLKVIYIIKVPPNCPVYLKNNYGIASIKNLNNQIKINSRFSKIGLENIHGNMNIETVFGDLLGTELWGDLTLNSRRSDMFFQKLYGNVNISAEYGLIKLLLDSKLKSLNLNAMNSEVFILGDNPFQMGMDIQVKNGELDFPSHPKYKVKEQKELGLRTLLIPAAKDQNIPVTIRINLGDLLFIKKN